MTLHTQARQIVADQEAVQQTPVELHAPCPLTTDPRAFRVISTDLQEIRGIMRRLAYGEQLAQAEAGVRMGLAGLRSAWGLYRKGYSWAQDGRASQRNRVRKAVSWLRSVRVLAGVA